MRDDLSRCGPIWVIRGGRPYILSFLWGLAPTSPRIPSEPRGLPGPPEPSGPPRPSDPQDPRDPQEPQDPQDLQTQNFTWEPARLRAKRGGGYTHSYTHTYT